MANEWVRNRITGFFLDEKAKFTTYRIKVTEEVKQALAGLEVGQFLQLSPSKAYDEGSTDGVQFNLQQVIPPAGGPGNGAVAPKAAPATKSRAHKFA